MWGLFKPHKFQSDVLVYALITLGLLFFAAALWVSQEYLLRTLSQLAISH